MQSTLHLEQLEEYRGVYCVICLPGALAMDNRNAVRRRLQINDP